MGFKKNLKSDFSSIKQTVVPKSSATVKNNDIANFLYAAVYFKINAYIWLQLKKRFFAQKNIWISKQIYRRVYVNTIVY